MPFPRQQYKDSDVPLQCNTTRTDNEAKLLVTSGPCFDHTLISVRDGFLDVESMQIDLPRLSVLTTHAARRFQRVL